MELRREGGVSNSFFFFFEVGFVGQNWIRYKKSCCHHQYLPSFLPEEPSRRRRVQLNAFKIQKPIQPCGLTMDIWYLLFITLAAARKLLQGLLPSTSFLLAWIRFHDYDTIILFFIQSILLSLVMQTQSHAGDGTFLYFIDGSELRQRRW